jgi:6-phosphogluconolactonase
MQGELGAEQGADAYDALLRGVGFDEDAARFDLVLLGLGPDAHIASLFPGQATVGERERLAVAVPDAGHEPFVPRVSLTLPALASADRIVFLVTGAAKAPAVTRTFGESIKPNPSVPATMLIDMHDSVRVLLDREAAARL